MTSNILKYINNKDFDTSSLINFIYILYKHYKSFLVIFSIFGLLSVALYIYNPIVYKSSVMCKINSLPPGITDQKVIRDFKYYFYNDEVIAEYLDKYDSQYIDYRSINNIVEISNNTFVSNENKLIRLNVNANSSFVLHMLSDNINSFIDFHKYAKFVNQKLTETYKKLADEDLLFIESRYSSKDIIPDVAVSNILALKRFISYGSIENSIVSVSLPIKPIENSLNGFLLFIFTFIVAFLVGIVYALFLEYLYSNKT